MEQLCRPSKGGRYFVIFSCDSVKEYHSEAIISAWKRRLDHFHKTDVKVLGVYRTENGTLCMSYQLPTGEILSDCI